MNTYWKIEDIDDKDDINYHEFDEQRYELKKIAFRDNQILWADITHYHGEDIYVYPEPIPKDDLKEFKDHGLISTQITKKEFYKLWNKITTEYPGEKY